MLSAERQKLEVRESFPATLEEVDRFCQSLRDAVTEGGWQQELFNIELIVREMLNNAVIHGSHEDPRMSVHCNLTIREDDWMVVRVTDQGGGFDWRSLVRRAADDHAASGRGIQILRQYSDRVAFNHKGNRMTVRRRLAG